MRFLLFPFRFIGDIRWSLRQRWQKHVPYRPQWQDEAAEGWGILESQPLRRR